YLIGTAINIALVSGVDLPTVQERFAPYLGEIARIQQNHYAPVVQMAGQLMLNLQGRSADPLVLTGELFDEGQLETFLTTGNRVLTFHFYFFKGLGQFLMGEADHAYASLSQAATYGDGATGLYLLS